MRSDLYVLIEGYEYDVIVNELYDQPELLLDRDILKNGKKFIAIEEKSFIEYCNNDVDKLAVVFKLRDEKQTCRCCGSHTHVFLQDYRGSECVSKYISCPACCHFDDKTYFELMHSEEPKTLLKADFNVA